MGTTGPDDLGLAGRVILVTGAGRGLGRSYALCLARHGARVAVHDAGVDKDGRRPDPAHAARVAEEIDAAGGAALALGELLAGADSCRRIVAATQERFGRLDGLIHSAGLVTWGDPALAREDAFSRMSAVNCDAAFWLAGAALPVMRAQGYGRIVLTTSGWALAPFEGSGDLVLYCLGKGAQFGLAMALARGAGHPGILTNILAPVANTRIYAGDVSEGRLAPEMVAGAAAWLASPACTLTGRVVDACDGRIALKELVTVATRDLGDAAADPAAAGAALAEMAGTETMAL